MSFSLPEKVKSSKDVKLTAAEKRILEGSPECRSLNKTFLIERHLIFHSLIILEKLNLKDENPSNICSVFQYFRNIAIFRRVAICVSIFQPGLVAGARRQNWSGSSKRFPLTVYSGTSGGDFVLLVLKGLHSKFA